MKLLFLCDGSPTMGRKYAALPFFCTLLVRLLRECGSFFLILGKLRNLNIVGCVVLRDNAPSTIQGAPTYGITHPTSY